MPPKKSNKRSTEYSLGLLNNINAPGRNTANIQDPKRRRTTHGDIFDIPISPSPTKSRKTPQTEPKSTNRLSLRNRQVPKFARLESPPNVSDNEEDNEPSNDESGSGDRESEPIQDVPGGNGEEELNDNQDELQRQAEYDPFPEPVDLFPAEDEDQADDQVGYKATNTQDDGPGDGSGYEGEDGTDNQGGEEGRDTQDDASAGQAGEKARNPPDDASADESEYADEAEADQAVKKARNSQDDASADGSEYEDEEEADDQSGEEAKDAQDDASEDESEYEDEGEADDHSSTEYQNHSTPTQQIVNADTLEVQTLEGVPGNQRDGTYISRMSANARESQNASSQLQEVPEIPNIEPLYPNQDHRSTRSDIFTWLTEATKESGFKDTWEAMRKTRKALKAHADPSAKDHFRGIIKLIARLRGLFETMTEDPASASSLKNQCSLIANSVFKENQWIIYTEAPDDEEDGAHLVNQLEAHIVPRLIDLIIHGFKTYKTMHDRGARQFRIILDLLWGSCDRISSLAQMHYDISGGVMARSKMVMRHVKTLKDALNDGRLRETPHRIPQRPLAYRQFELEEVDSHISCGRWTHAEKVALRDGLQSYEGEDRYIDIKCDNTIGGQLSQRILQHIRGQAVKLGLDDP
ncbi:hypothetical protein PENSOL_c001G01782 [Penicillium solitum]|uniref:Uncharacterized protein n=1 Tax=Penicillium solitum TaxID=60172 RepID=A0A1V6RQK1_9EURO|nr:uncharacterized protein PENSOL_c001G01782 [Penicillium solitum]OQE03754.1 hypothetical protein PENSOL_c001G01782 [Penicillium solitum]